MTKKSALELVERGTMITSRRCIRGCRDISQLLSSHLTFFVSRHSILELNKPNNSPYEPIFDRPHPNDNPLLTASLLLFLRVQ